MKTIQLFYGLTILGILFSCSSGSDDSSPTPTPDPDPDPTPTVITYNSHISSIMTSNCTSCHSNSPSQGAPMALTTYAFVKDAVENRGLISRINNSSNPMPPTGGLLSQSHRDLIQAWKDQGFIEN